MSRIRAVALTLFAMLSTLPAYAAAPTYSHLDFAFLSSEFKTDGSSVKNKADGGRFNFNVSLERWLYFTGEYNHADFDTNNQQLRDTSLGFGAHTLKNNYQFFGAGTYERTDTFGTNLTDEGFGVLAGVRVPFLKRFEAQADIKYLSFGDDAATKKKVDLTRYRLTAQARLSPVWAFVGTYQLSDYDTGERTDWTAGFRAYFKTQYDVPQRKKPVESSGNK